MSAEERLMLTSAVVNWGCRVVKNCCNDCGPVSLQLNPPFNRELKLHLLRMQPRDQHWGLSEGMCLPVCGCAYLCILCVFFFTVLPRELVFVHVFMHARFADLCTALVSLLILCVSVCVTFYNVKAEKGGCRGEPNTPGQEKAGNASCLCPSMPLP